MKNRKQLTRGNLILIILIIIIIISLIIGFYTMKNKNTKKYKAFETELKTAAENYYIIKGLGLKNGEEKKITLTALKKQKLVSNELKDKCAGYVIASSERDNYTNEYDIYYYPYIKCDNKYISPNYSEY